MLFGRRQPERALSFGGNQLVFTDTHQYLGVCLDNRLSFATHVRERTVARTNILQALSSHTVRALFFALGVFYVNATRSVIGYSSVADYLELAQNDDFRVIIGALS